MAPLGKIFGINWERVRTVLIDWHILTSNPQLAQIEEPYPQMVARQVDNLKDYWSIQSLPEPSLQNQLL